MQQKIRKFSKDEEEYKNLELMASLLTWMSPNRKIYRVEDCYFDLGLDWMWTTIICNPFSADSYQALYPAMHERIISASTVYELIRIATEFFKYDSLDNGELHLLNKLEYKEDDR